MVENQLFILTGDRDNIQIESWLVVYRIVTAGGDPASLSLLKRYDAEDLDREVFLASSFAVLKKSVPFTYYVFLVEPDYGIHILDITLDKPPYYVKAIHFNLNRVILNTFITFLRIEVYGALDAGFTLFDVLLTTSNNHHFGLVLDVANIKVKAHTVYQRYAALTAANRLTAAGDFFMIFAYPGNSMVKAQTSAHLLYRRVPAPSTMPTNPPNFVNVYAGIDELFVPLLIKAINGLLTQVTIGDNTQLIFYQAGIGAFKLHSYDVAESASVIISDKDVNSRWIELVAKNDYGESSVRIDVHGKSWLQRHVTLVVILSIVGVVVIISIIALVCYLRKKGNKKEDKFGILDDA
eukprot:TRINITY_DN277_c0_g1_i2.p1 TRINITY_DN277_c0_g1~~TRINITY_DN277_c0_g1_i2.p1  ORF type:complete len:351 (+),score=85.83 TRINITY_DN277_c0_g1_i2:593-1645(+)